MLLCDVVVALDNVARRAWIVSSGLPEADPARPGRACRAPGWTTPRGVSPGWARSARRPSRRRRRPITSNFTREAYEDAVRRVIDLILAGDVFQANLSQRFRATLPEGLTPFDLFRRLAHGNPAPFAAYVKDGDVVGRLLVARALPAPRRPPRRDPADQGHPPPRAPRPMHDEALAASSPRARRTGPRT